MDIRHFAFDRIESMNRMFFLVYLIQEQNLKKNIYFFLFVIFKEQF